MKISISSHHEGKLSLEVADPHNRTCKLTLSNEGGSMEILIPIDAVKVAINAISNMSRVLVRRAAPDPRKSGVKLKDHKTNRKS